jgi:hypothetical protein
MSNGTDKLTEHFNRVALSLSEVMGTLEAKREKLARERPAGVELALADIDSDREALRQQVSRVCDLF